MSQNQPEPIWRTFRFYLDVEAKDEFPDMPEEEWRVLEEARKSFYAMIDDGMELDVVEVLDDESTTEVKHQHRP